MGEIRARFDQPPVSPAAFILPLALAVMSSRRLLKAAAAVREVVGLSILADLKDPRIRDVTVTHVEVSPDMRHAKVHVSVMGNETQQSLSLRGLQSAAGFLQSKIAERIETRYTPRLMFVLDQGIKKSIEMARILKQVLPGDAPSDDEPATALDKAIEVLPEKNPPGHPR
jgi:ribosome-binding factor A